MNCHATFPLIVLFAAVVHTAYGQERYPQRYPLGLPSGIPTVFGDLSNDNTSAINAALATCQDVLVDSVVIAGPLEFRKGCYRQTLWFRGISYLMHSLYVPGGVAIRGTSGNANQISGLWGPPNTYLNVKSTIPVCQTFPFVTGSGTSGTNTINVSNASPFVVDSYVSVSNNASGIGHSSQISAILGKAVTIRDKIATTFTNQPVNCDTPGIINIEGTNVTISGLTIGGMGAGHASPLFLNGGNRPVAQVLLENIALSTAGNTVPLVIDGAFEIMAQGLTLMPPTRAPSVEITNDNTTFQAGTITIKDSLIYNRGMLIRSNNQTGLPEDITVQNITYENLAGSFVDIDSSSGIGFSGLILDRLVNADRVASTYGVAEVGSSPKGIRDVTVTEVRNWFGLQLSNVNIFGLTILGGGSPGFGIVNLGPQQNYTWLPGDSVDMPGYQHGMGTPSFGTALSVNQAASTWRSSGGGIVTLVPGPDGSGNSAGLITCPSGNCYVIVYRSSQPAAAGDWIVAGLWSRSGSGVHSISQNASTAQLTISGVTIQGSAGTGAVRLTNTLSTRIGEQWVPIVNAFKVSASKSSSAVYTFQISASSRYPQAFWKPWVVRIPAGSMSDEEVIRLMRTAQ